jgi:uncharacterized DUF497 family protein
MWFMPFYFFAWSDAIVEHLARNGVSEAEFEEIVSNPEDEDVSRSTGRPMAIGVTSTGRILACVYEFIDDETILPVTAYEIDQD